MQTALSFVRRTWKLDPALTATGLAMLTLLPFTLLGLALDDRVVGGVPAWLKPAKFAASTGVYSLTLPWVLAVLTDWPRLRRVTSRLTAGVMVLEVGIICIQAWRGTASHFNVSTPLDAALFGVMGAAIAAQTVAATIVTLALFRQRFDDRVLATAMRAGMLLSVLGAAVGGLMTSPTHAQLTQAIETGRMERSGGHTVGAPDGGPGLPGLGWSRTHGDLRVPHFIGLHAVQVLPLVAVWLRRKPEPRWTRLASMGATSVPGAVDAVSSADSLASRARMRLVAGVYAAVFGTALVQALLGQPLLPRAAVVSLVAASIGSVLVTWVRENGRSAVPAAREARRTA